jgi:hypothetical protein
MPILAVVAWAGSDRGADRGREPIGAMRQLAQTNTRTTITGQLKCTLAEANAGQACPLQIQNAETGEVLNITGSNEAMRMYQDGKTQVVATGEIRGSSLRIHTIRSQ